MTKRPTGKNQFRLQLKGSLLGDCMMLVSAWSPNPGCWYWKRCADFERKQDAKTVIGLLNMHRRSLRALAFRYGSPSKKPRKSSCKCPQCGSTEVRHFKWSVSGMSKTRMVTIGLSVRLKCQSCLHEYTSVSHAARVLEMSHDGTTFVRNSVKP